MVVHILPTGVSSSLVFDCCFGLFRMGLLHMVDNDVLVAGPVVQSAGELSNGGRQRIPTEGTPDLNAQTGDPPRARSSDKRPLCSPKVPPRVLGGTVYYALKPWLFQWNRMVVR
jgi:hypothetical protein